MGRKPTYDQLEKRVLELEKLSLESRQKVVGSENETLYQGLISEMIFGYALHEIIYDETGKPSDFRFLEVNPVFEKVIGLSAENLIGKTVLEILPQTESHWLDTYGKVARDGKPVLYENYSQELGKFFEVQVFSPQQGRVASIFKDISKRKQTEEALRDSEKRYRLVSELSSDFAYSFQLDSDDTLRLDWVTGALERITGFTTEDLRMRGGWTSLIYPDDLPVPLGQFQALKDGQPAVVEYRILTSSGAVRWVRDYARPLWSEEQKRVTHIYGAIQDNTTSKQAEDALRKAHDKLEFRVKHRTEKLVKANLELQAEISERQRAEDKVKASLREKEVLLQEIHHRVKNNMQIIVSLLMLQCTNIEDKCYLNMFKDAMDRIKSMALVHEKLYQSKDFTKVDIIGYIRSLVKNLILSHVAVSDKVSLKIDAHDVSLGLDSAIICGLIINELVTNSLKYAFKEDTKGQIRIGVELIDEDEVEIHVADNGVGMPENFDIKNSSTLGLQIVTALVEQQLEGKLNLVSGNGTQYCIRFKESLYSGKG
jgi:PAS domain S-box-containing protein